tara:strand:+ start:91 stop:399 length:309 start_codon:yes stop_codon:yes gene_type:complete
MIKPIAIIIIVKNKKVYLNPSKIKEPSYSRSLLNNLKEVRIGAFIPEIRYATEKSTEELSIENERFVIEISYFLLTNLSNNLYVKYIKKMPRISEIKISIIE